MRVHLPTYFKISSWSLRSVILTFIILAMTTFLCALGTWQLKRGYQKQHLIAAQNNALQSGFITVSTLTSSAIDNIRYRKTQLKGSFLNEKTFLLDNQTYNGKIGYHVLTPFEISKHNFVLVNRGWVPLGASRQKLPEILRLEGVFTIEGRIEKGYVNPLISRAIETPDIQWPLRIQKLDFELFNKLLNGSVHPIIVMLDAPSEGIFSAIPLSGKWLTPERHFGYAFQWYSLAGLLLLLTLITFWRSKKI